MAGTPMAIVPQQVVELLVCGALDQLWYQRQPDPDGGEEPNAAACCPFCEARCAALLELYMAGQLSEMVPDWRRGDDNEWWSASDGAVSYAFLDEAWGWRMPCCDEQVRVVTKAPGCWVTRYYREYVTPQLRNASGGQR